MIERRFARHDLTPILRDRAHGMRADRASAEAKLWYFLGNRRLNGFRFRQHKIVGPIKADFYCFQAKLIVEIGREPHTPEQTRWVEANGHRVISASFEDINNQLVGVLESVLHSCCQNSNAEEQQLKMKN